MQRTAFWKAVLQAMLGDMDPATAWWSEEHAAELRSKQRNDRLVVISTEGAGSVVRSLNADPLFKLAGASPQLDTRT